MRQPRRRLTDEERVLRAVPEKDFMKTIIVAARWLGYLVYHDLDSRSNVPGWPDLFLVGTGEHAGRMIVLECKTETGRATAEQLVWLGAFMEIPGADVLTVRPRDIDRVLELLQARTGRE